MGNFLFVLATVAGITVGPAAVFMALGFTRAAIFAPLAFLLFYGYLILSDTQDK